MHWLIHENLARNNWRDQHHEAVLCRAGDAKRKRADGDQSVPSKALASPKKAAKRSKAKLSFEDEMDDDAAATESFSLAASTARKYNPPLMAILTVHNASTSIALASLHHALSRCSCCIQRYWQLA